MNDSLLLNALADACEAAAAAFRRHATPTSPSQQQPAPRTNSVEDVVARARIMHPLLGHRQAEVIELLAKDHPATTTTGALSRAMVYDQANVYLTLQGLIQASLVVKDATQHPHQYRLSPNLFDPDIFDL